MSVAAKPACERRRSVMLSVSLAFLTLAAVMAAFSAQGCSGSGGSGGTGTPTGAELAITTVWLPDAFADSQWSANLEATGGAAPYDWQVLAMPAWVQLDQQTGLLSGTVPAAASGVEFLTVVVRDATDTLASRDFVLVYNSASQPQAPILLTASVDAQDGHFATHLTCATCHSNSPTATAMRDNANREIAPANLWRATMMANSFRDPYFRAVLASEMDLHSNLSAEIQDKCLTCHAPQATYEAHSAAGMQTLAEIYAGNSPRSHIGLDGVSCTLCHQIEGANLGTAASFSGKFSISPAKVAFGPHANPFAMPMEATSGYTPVVASHMTESKLCASCHTLHTNVLDLNHNPTGNTFPEQVPYLEWRNSVYSTEVANPGPAAASCQSCHMPTTSRDGVSINTRIARQPGGADYPPISPRQPYGRHVLVGANTIMLSILRDNAAHLNSPASTAEFNAQIERTRRFLQTQTADVEVRNLNLNAGTLGFDVHVTNRAGHKFPTAYPSRRAWLRVLVRNGDGNVVWSSGDYDATGRIVGPNRAPLAIEMRGGPVEPHHQQITSQDQVQIYETVHADVLGNPTFSLLFANSHYKDNRLLPLGWSDTHPDIADMQPVGTAGDADFVGGSDTVQYQISGLTGTGYTVEVELLYQTISAREATELFQRDHIREVNVFRQYYQSANRRPELIATHSAQAP
jgi:hypothetical protein